MRERSAFAAGVPTRPAPTRPALARLVGAIALGTALALAAGCDRTPEPHPSYENAPAATAEPLAGAPQTAPAPPAAAEPGTEAPTAAPPVDENAPPPLQDEAPTAAPPRPAAGTAPDVGLVAMAPIPNPEDGGPVPPARRAYAGRSRPTVAAPPAQARARHVARLRHRARPAPAGVHARRTTAPTPAAHAPAQLRHAPARTAALRHPAPATPRSTPAVRHAPPATLRPARTAPAPAAATAVTPALDARTEALRQALSAAVARGAVLSAPKPLEGQSEEVTLTVPADFSDTLRKEAGRQAMSDAAASANLDAVLAGDGWSVVPAGAQSQPVREGQPTVFRWTVTAAPGQRGPLRADVDVNLQGGGSQVLDLGAVDGGAAPASAPRWWGAALLVLVVGLGLAWLYRARSADARIAASRRRARRPQGEVRRERGLDLSPDDRRA